MSSFIRSTLKEINSSVEVTNKSTLIQVLGAAWYQKYQGDHNLFFQCFKYLTEFRSFSLDKNLFFEIKDFMNDEVFIGVMFLWEYLEILDLYDEQRAYQHLGENFNKLNERDRKFIFWGFSNINSIQIDMFVEMGREADLYFPLHVDTVSNLKRSDWHFVVNGPRKPGECKRGLFRKKEFS